MAIFFKDFIEHFRDHFEKVLKEKSPSYLPLSHPKYFIIFDKNEKKKRNLHILFALKVAKYLDCRESRLLEGYFAPSWPWLGARPIQRLANCMQDLIVLCLRVLCPVAGSSFRQLAQKDNNKQINGRRKKKTRQCLKDKWCKIIQDILENNKEKSIENRLAIKEGRCMDGWMDGLCHPRKDLAVQISASADRIRFDQTVSFLLLPTPY